MNASKSGFQAWPRCWLADIRHEEADCGGQRREWFGDGYTLLFVIEGDGTATIEDSVLKLSRGSGLMLHPGTVVYLSAGDRGLRYWSLVCGADSIVEEGGDPSAFDSSDLLPAQGAIQCQPFSMVVEWMDTIVRGAKSPYGASTAWIDGQIAFLELLRLVAEQNANKRVETIQEAVEKTAQLIRSHASEPWKIEEMAEEANVSRSYYSRVFKEITGLNPVDFVTEARIELSKKLLLTTDDRIADIALRTGFNSEYYFNRRFKQKVGLSPGQYRSNSQGSLKIFAPFMEDYLVALGLTPVMQCVQEGWGKQTYLNLEVPEIDVEGGDTESLRALKPDFIVLDIAFERWMARNRLEQVAPVYRIPHVGEDWRATLRTFSEWTSRREEADEVIERYERKAVEAKKVLQRRVQGETVACLRISALGVSLYGGPAHGYTGPVLYRDLGLRPHPLVNQLAGKQRKVVLSMEQLVRLEADHLFVTFDKRHSASAGEERSLLKMPEWLSLPAVRGGRVYEVDFMAWMNYGVLSHERKIDDVLSVLG
jgi:AraC-like DNA-binding protein/ABC-type Fe3+-hydroxamate transport system substrate-binding protein